MLHRLGLRGRAIALCVLLALSTALCIAGGLIWRSYTLSLASMTNRAKQHAKDLCYSVEAALLLGDTRALQRLLRATVMNGALTTVQVFDALGATVAHDCYGEHNGSGQCAGGLAFPQPRPASAQPVVEINGTRIFVACNVYRAENRIDLGFAEETASEPEGSRAKPIGTVMLAYDLSEIHSQVKAHVVFSGLLVALVIAGSCGLVVPAVGRLLHPVHDLVETTTVIAGGDLSRRASENAAGEIGVLARSFNRMAEALRANTEQLEHQVRERTAELAKKEAYLRTVLRSVPDCVKMIDARGRILDMNPAGISMLGLGSVEQVRGRSVLEFICASNRSAFEALNRRVFSGQGGSLVYQVQPRTGGSLWVETSAVPLYDGKDTIVAHLATTRDVTEARRKVAELHEAKERAEAGDRAKSEFIANVSHEIRTPMNGIIGMTQIALDAARDEEQRSNLETVLECAESLLELLNEILDFSKLGAGKLVLESTNLDIGGCIRSVVDLVGPEARQKGISLSCRLDEQVPHDLIGDPHRLRQVILNLVNNAVKFTERGSIVVSTTAEQVSEASVSLLLRVQDTGIGIPRDRLSAVFESFTQADGTTTRKYGGTGLGLAICKQLVELMGGRIWAESTPGCGSTFLVALEIGRRGADRCGWSQSAGGAEDGDVLPVLNVEDALRRLEGDRELLRESVAALLAALPAQVCEMKRALGENHPAAVQSVAHDLKGAASTVGAEALVRAAGEVERSALYHARATIEDALGRLEGCVEQLRVEAEPFLWPAGDIA